MIGAVYCRVSSSEQRDKGTSLDTQRDQALGKAATLGWNIPQEYIIQEDWTGTDLHRPGLVQLLGLAQSGQINGVIFYTFDRLYRPENPGDEWRVFEVLQRFQDAGVQVVWVDPSMPTGGPLEFVFQSLYAWKAGQERRDIVERMMRGKHEMARRGKIPGGGCGRIYGYYYIKSKYDGGGVRGIDEDEAKWVKEIYRWFLEEGLSLKAIAKRLRVLVVPAPGGGPFWHRQAVHSILSNPAYIGKTYVFTVQHTQVNGKRKRIPRPKEEWIEVKNATPAIVSEELQEAAVRKLQRNKALSKRNSKGEYLLRGFIRCKHCGKSYNLRYVTRKLKDGKKTTRYYICSGRNGDSPIICRNNAWQADRIEAMAWQEIERILEQPEHVMAELDKREQEGDASKIEFLEEALESIDTRLKAARKRERQLIRSIAYGLDEELIEEQKAEIYDERQELMNERGELVHRIENAQSIKLDKEGLRRACELVKQNLGRLTVEEKRIALEALDIRVLVDGKMAYVEGNIPVMPVASVSECSSMPHFATSLLHQEGLLPLPRRYPRSGEN